MKPDTVASSNPILNALPAFDHAYIGYGITAIVLAALVGVASFALGQWWEQRKLRLAAQAIE